MFTVHNAACGRRFRERGRQPAGWHVKRGRRWPRLHRQLLGRVTSPAFPPAVHLTQEVTQQVTSIQILQLHSWCLPCQGQTVNSAVWYRLLRNIKVSVVLHEHSLDCLMFQYCRSLLICEYHISRNFEKISIFLNSRNHEFASSGRKIKTTRCYTVHVVN